MQLFFICTFLLKTVLLTLIYVYLLIVYLKQKFFIAKSCDLLLSLIYWVLISLVQQVPFFSEWSIFHILNTHSRRSLTYCITTRIGKYYCHTVHFQILDDIPLLRTNDKKQIYYGYTWIFVIYARVTIV